ncbi:nitrous oxide reductase family maturation protein NosD [Flavisolibacter nicotianae]|uniref:nitrous oxide reductase family maturation protein NosD n=1 Tax=Flavisolibacter nicotianae TaxID=2364882 RepID=UPI000EAEB94D|nr:nitrous oxide reductase family maturation protein NosD [Flavisolibacter nicotianae]
MKRNITILLLLLSTTVFANSIRVGKGQRITSLHKAVEMAQAGDTILLQGGRYKEGNTVINKSLTLLGENNPVLDGENKYEILTVTGSGIVIKGIMFENSGYSSMNDYASISVIDASYVLIENNTIRNAYFAIHVANATTCVVQHNTISGLTKTEQTSGNGIHLWKCDDMLVKDNDVQGHRDGIYFEFVTNSVIQQNNSHNNIRYGLHFMFSNNDSYIDNTFRDNGAGVAVMYSHHVLMQGNHFVHNWGGNAYGLLLKEISDGQILQNKFDNNTVGILMESTNRINVDNNDFGSNGYAIRMAASCNENILQYNAFAGNTFDVATNGTLMLNTLRNNYWDKYDGYDMNKDGYGDVPYHPISMYSMVIEQNPNAAVLMRSFMVTLLDKAEKAIPSLTPENMFDEKPMMKRSSL